MNDKISLHKLLNNSKLNNIPYGGGETRTYLWFVKNDILGCVEDREVLKKLHFPDEHQQKRLAEIETRLPKLEDEFFNLTRFGIGQFTDALRRTTHKNWKFSHAQVLNKETNQWNLKLQIKDSLGKEGFTYALLPLKGHIDNFSNMDEIRSKLLAFRRGTGAEKEMADAALMYFSTGDPQFSFEQVEQMPWDKAKIALRQHQCSHFINSELYKSFGPSNMLVHVRTPEKNDEIGR